jgi:hypothetical protein
LVPPTRKGGRNIDAANLLIAELPEHVWLWTIRAMPDRAGARKVLGQNRARSQRLAIEEANKFADASGLDLDPQYEIRGLA